LVDSYHSRLTPTGGSLVNGFKHTPTGSWTPATPVHSTPVECRNSINNKDLTGKNDNLLLKAATNFVETHTITTSNSLPLVKNYNSKSNAISIRNIPTRNIPTTEVIPTGDPLNNRVVDTTTSLSSTLTVCRNTTVAVTSPVLSTTDPNLIKAKENTDLSIPPPVQQQTLLQQRNKSETSLLTLGKRSSAEALNNGDEPHSKKLKSEEQRTSALTNNVENINDHEQQQLLRQTATEKLLIPQQQGSTNVSPTKQQQTHSEPVVVPASQASPEAMSIRVVVSEQDSSLASTPSPCTTAEGVVRNQHLRKLSSSSSLASPRTSIDSNPEFEPSLTGDQPAAVKRKVVKVFSNYLNCLYFL